MFMQPGEQDREDRLPAWMEDADMLALSDANLYFVDAENGVARPNFRYCKPETPEYTWDAGENHWSMSQYRPAWLVEAEHQAKVFRDERETMEDVRYG